LVPGSSPGWGANFLFFLCRPPSALPVCRALA